MRKAQHDAAKLLCVNPRTFTRLWLQAVHARASPERPFSLRRFTAAVLEGCENGRRSEDLHGEEAEMWMFSDRRKRLST